MMRRSPGLRGNFQLAYGTPFWTSKGAPMGSLVRAGFRGLGNSGDSSITLDYPTGADSTVTPSSGGGFNWGLLTNLVNTGSQAFSNIYRTIQPVPQGCVQQIGPNGQSYTSCGQPYASLGIPGALTGGTGLMPIFLIGGGLLAVALLARGRG